MSRLILHIGTHKTATTTIQRFFSNNRTALAKRGVFYPDYALVNKAPHYAHLGMVNALSGQHKSYSRDLAERFFAKVRARMVDFDTTIVSAEPFYRHFEYAPECNHNRAPEAYWLQRDAYISRMRELFGPAEVVVVFRRQADYAQSLYQEHVKVTRYLGNFQKFLGEFWFHFKFLQQARAWDAAFPGLKAIGFDALTGTEDVTGEFCRLLGIPAEGLAPSPPANTGLPVDLVVLKRQLHRTGDSKDDLRVRIEALASHLPQEVTDNFPNRSFFASSADMQAFQDSFAEDNDGLRKYLLNPVAPGHPVFPPGFRKGLNYGDRIKPQVLKAMLEMSLDAT